MTDYAASGVDIELGDDASKVLYRAAKETWKNRNGTFGEVVQLFDDFTGLRAIEVGGLPKGTLMNLGFDGVGTKVEIGERMGKHDTVAFDLFAMVCDDAVVRGAEPVIIGSILDVGSLGKNGKNHIGFVKQLARGYINAAKAANVVVVNGEVAELGARVQGHGDFAYNWGAGIAWFGRKDRMFTGKEIKSGDYIMGLREDGFRSNGLSLVRKIMRDTYGENWHNQPFGDWKMGDLALTPSKIYTAAVVNMFGGFQGEPQAEIHGVAHITGGGIPGKLGRVLKPSGLGAALYDPFSPCGFVRHIQEVGKVTDREAYNTWNMGQGMLIITPEPDKVERIAENYGIDSQKVGRITKRPGIVISNRGAYASREPELIFN